MNPHQHSCIEAGAQIVLRLPSGLLKSLEIQPNTTISIGKFGSFSSNSLLGRPYHLTYEVLDKQDGQTYPKLRVVPASELHAEVLSDTLAAGSSAQDDVTTGVQDGSTRLATAAKADSFDIISDSGEVLLRNNRLTIDDPSRQQLTMEEIEELKRVATGGGKEVIAKIMAAHSAIDEKTTFSLAKYTLRKSRKYMKRFQVLPMDTGVLTDMVTEKEPSRIMELRMEGLGLITSWANAHFAENEDPEVGPEEGRGGGKWLVVDGTGGLVVAIMAENLGILYPEVMPKVSPVTPNGKTPEDTHEAKAIEEATQPDPQTTEPSQNGSICSETALDTPKQAPHKPLLPSINPKKQHQTATSNTLTLVHDNTQPNLALLKYFGFATEDPSIHHPLYTNLRTLTWLQLLDPEADQLYHEPQPVIPESELAGWKSGKRSAYFKKRRRWERVKRVVDETREGEFDGLVVASHMKPDGVLKHLVSLVRGGGQVVVYSPTVESLTELMDLYSRERKGSYLKLFHEQDQLPDLSKLEEDFPVNPTLLLNPMLQTARAIEWQVLPGRTHPLMTSRGGAEGYLFTATRVIPAQQPVAGRGNFAKKRKA